MEKWIKKVIVDHQDSLEEPDIGHISSMDMASFIDGQLDKAGRERVIFHLNRCQKCSEVLNMTLADLEDEDGETEGRQPWWDACKKPVFSLAASLLLMVMVGAGIYQYSPWRTGRPVDLTVMMDGNIKNLLMENSNIQWQSQDRIKRLETILVQKGMKLGKLSGVVMSAPYHPSKSFPSFGGEEELVITIKEGIAHIEVKEKKK